MVNISNVKENIRNIICSLFFLLPLFVKLDIGSVLIISIAKNIDSFFFKKNIDSLENYDDMILSSIPCNNSSKTVQLRFGFQSCNLQMNVKIPQTAEGHATLQSPGGICILQSKYVSAFEAS